MAGRDPFEDIERLFDVMSGDLGGAGGGQLAVDVVDTGDAFEVVADLPGYDGDSLDVKLTDETTLFVAAERESDRTSEDGRFVTRERQRQAVSRQVGLPEPVDEEGTGATFENGVLTVTLPKRSGAPDDGTDIPVN